MYWAGEIANEDNEDNKRERKKEKSHAKAATEAKMRGMAARLAKRPWTE